jgi:hypothetical protein
MKFNRVKSLTSREDDIIDAIKDSNVVELDKLNRMIKKKNN